MLIPALTIRPEYAMTLDQAQTVVDFESMLVRMGLTYSLQCIHCDPRVNLRGHVVGADLSKHGKNYTLKLECNCSSRVYRGDGLILAKPPAVDVAPRDVIPEVKPEVGLDRADMFLFDTMNQLLTRIFRMRYWMRCMRCENENQNDGVYGQNQSTGGQFVVECSCTKRVYAGHDAPVSVQ